MERKNVFELKTPQRSFQAWGVGSSPRHWPFGGCYTCWGLLLLPPFLAHSCWLCEGAAREASDDGGHLCVRRMGQAASLHPLIPTSLHPCLPHPCLPSPLHPIPSSLHPFVFSSFNPCIPSSHLFIHSLRLFMLLSLHASIPPSIHPSIPSSHPHIPSPPIPSSHPRIPASLHLILSSFHPCIPSLHPCRCDAPGAGGM